MNVIEYIITFDFHALKCDRPADDPEFYILHTWYMPFIGHFHQVNTVPVKLRISYIDDLVRA